MDSLWGKFKRRGAIATPQTPNELLLLYELGMQLRKELRIKIGHYNQSRISIFLKGRYPLTQKGVSNSLPLEFDLHCHSSKITLIVLST